MRALVRYSVVVGLSGKEYCTAVEVAFADRPGLVFPFAGLPLGKSLQAVKQAMISGDPRFSRAEAVMVDPADLLQWSAWRPLTSASCQPEIPHAPGLCRPRAVPHSSRQSVVLTFRPL